MHAECELVTGHQPVYPGETSVQYLSANQKHQGREEECTNLVEVDARQSLLGERLELIAKVTSDSLVKPLSLSRLTIRAFLSRMTERSRRRQRRCHARRRAQ